MSYSLFILEVLDIAKEKDMPINEQIRAKQMLVIGPNGEQLGIKSKDEALTLASYAGFDLVLMNSNAKPPVCKIMDYNKFKYENKKKIIQYDLNFNIVKKWESICEAARKTNISQSNISRCCNNKQKTAKKYIWKFEEEN